MRMGKYVVEVTQVHRYEVEVESGNEYDALELVREMDTDQLEEFEIDARWDFEVVEEK
jgi:hypothetical protein